MDERLLLNSIGFDDSRELPREPVLALYRAVAWSSAEHPDTLMTALGGSHSVISAWEGQRLIGLGSAISDGALVVYYPHLLVLPEYQHRGIGREIMRRLMDRYSSFHQHAILADGNSIGFYAKLGFTRPTTVQAMWIYAGQDHG